MSSESAERSASSAISWLYSDGALVCLDALAARDLAAARVGAIVQVFVKAEVLLSL